MRPLLWGIDFERGVGSFLRLDSLPMSYELCIQLTSLPLLNYCRYITLVILPLKYAGAYMLHLDLAPAPGSDRLSDDPERAMSSTRVPAYQTAYRSVSTCHLGTLNIARQETS